MRLARVVWWVGLGLVLVPFGVSAVRLIFGVGGDYAPVQDHAVIEMFLRDVGRHPVLLGLYSRADWSHPGPAELYALAPFYWLTGGSSIGAHLGALAVNAACMAGTAAIARRRGGTPVLLCTLVGLALVTRTLGADFLSDPWNTYIPVLPFLLLLFLTWSMLCGDLWALPLAAVAATFTAQTHVGFVLLSLPLLAIGAAALTRQHWQDRRALGRAVGLTAGLLALLWLPPLLDVLWEAPSNARQTIEWFERADEGVHTPVQGWQVVAAQFTVDAEWFAGAKVPALTTGEPMAVHQAVFPLLMLPLVATAIVLFRRGEEEDEDSRSGRALLITLVVALGLSIAAVARTVGPAYDYRLRWTWMPPILAFVLVAGTGWRAVVRRTPGLESRLLIPAGLVALLILAAVDSTAAARAGTPYATDSEIMDALAGPVLDELDHPDDHPDDQPDDQPDERDGQIVVDRYAMSLGTLAYGRGLVLQLERHGYDARVPASRIPFLPESRNEDPDEPVAARLVVAADEQVDELLDDPGYTLLSEWSPHSQQEQDDIADQQAQLADDFAAGRIVQTDFLPGTAALTAELHGHENVVAYDVAVFLDERPPPERRP